MGKSNRIRADRANNKIANPIKYKKKTGMPLWLKTMLAAVVAFAVLFGCVFGVLSQNGFFLRHTKAVYSDNYKVSANMLTYFYQTQYQNFQTNYSSYMSYFSLDTSKSLKEQTFGDTSKGYGYETSFLGAFEGTWFDYFMSLATEQAKQTLVYCEEANARGISLDDKDMEDIKASIDTISQTATLYGYPSANAYVSAMYGSGVNVNDVKKAIELSTLATKCMIAIQDEIEAGITDTDIDNAYNASKLDFNLIDYSYYTITVNYENIVHDLLGEDHTEAEVKEKADELLAKYKEKIAEAKTVADTMKGLTSVADFNKYVFEYIANEYYDAAYEALEWADGELPEETVITDTKKAVIASVVADIIADKEETESAYTEAEGVYTVYGKTVTEKFAKSIHGLKTDIFTDMITDKDTYVVEKANHNESDDFSKWAFEDGRKANETKVIYKGDGSEEGEIENKDGYFTASTYFLTKTQYIDDSLTKNVAFMTFATEAEAKAAIEAFKAGTLSVEAFEAIATEKNATANTKAEDYVEGTLGVEDLDEWLFDEATAVGAYTEAPIAVDESTYLVAYYYGDGEKNWRVTVKSSVFNERYEEYYNGMEAKYPITIKDKAINKIDG